MFNSLQPIVIVCPHLISIIPPEPPRHYGQRPIRWESVNTHPLPTQAHIYRYVNVSLCARACVSHSVPPLCVCNRPAAMAKGHSLPSTLGTRRKGKKQRMSRSCRTRARRNSATLTSARIILSTALSQTCLGVGARFFMYVCMYTYIHTYVSWVVWASGKKERRRKTTTLPLLGYS